MPVAVSLYNAVTVLLFNPVLFATSEMRSFSRPISVERWQRIIVWKNRGVLRSVANMCCAQPLPR